MRNQTGIMIITCNFSRQILQIIQQAVSATMPGAERAAAKAELN